jgi:two-component system, chemotaxis family, response regulator Rcp1
VDDNPADVDLMREILGTCKCHYHVSSVADGEQAISFLHRRGKYIEAPTPDLVILDLNLPGKDGRTVLKELKSDSLFCKVPIVVFTASQASSDITSSYELGANCYIQKPVDFDQFRETLKTVGLYWLLINQAPVIAGAAKGAGQT